MPDLHHPCACRRYCGDIPENDPGEEYAVCKGLRFAPDPPFVKLFVVHRDELRAAERNAS